MKPQLGALAALIIVLAVTVAIVSVAVLSVAYWETWWGKLTGIVGCILLLFSIYLTLLAERMP